MRRERRCDPGRILLVLALLPALVLKPAPVGGAAWFHSHGSSGGHVHVLAMRVDHAHLDALHALHDAEHRHDHGGGTHEEGRPEEPAPRGLLIELPHVLAARPRGATSSSATSLAPIVALHSPALRPAPVESPLRPADPRSAWPNRRAKRSGVAALLRSSHAILI